MTTRYKPAQIGVEQHEWLRTEAFLQRTSITALLTEAVELLREQREAEAAKAQKRTTGRQMAVTP